MPLTTDRSKYPNQRDIAKCRGSDCGADIVWLKTKAGKRIPVDAMPAKKTAAEKWRPPYAGETEYVHGEHKPHHIDCPNAEDFR
jgi:hypothetical protein